MFGLPQFFWEVVRSTIEGAKSGRLQGSPRYAPTKPTQLRAADNDPVVENFYNQWKGSEPVKIGKLFEIRLPTHVAQRRESYQYGFSFRGSRDADLSDILGLSSPQ